MMEAPHGMRYQVQISRTQMQTNMALHDRLVLTVILFGLEQPKAECLRALTMVQHGLFTMWTISTTSFSWRLKMRIMVAWNYKMELLVLSWAYCELLMEGLPGLILLQLV